MQLIVGGKGGRFAAHSQHKAAPTGGVRMTC